MLFPCGTGECDFGRPLANVLKTSAKVEEDDLCCGGEGASPEDMRPVGRVDHRIERRWSTIGGLSSYDISVS